MQRRGRSRHVSRAAIARRASEERRRRPVDFLQEQRIYSRPPLPLPPPKLIPLPPPSYEADITIPPIPVLSPTSRSRSLSPTPIHTPPDSEPCTSVSADHSHTPPSPRSYEDQLYVAYALDDIRLAKIILLKLKGIEVTDDNDPRIDAVRDEDFDAYFVPAGGLVVDIGGKKPAVDVEEGRRREREKLEERERNERLKECERKWDEERRRVSEEKLKAIKKREEEQKQKAEIIKQIKLEAERMRFQRRGRPGLQRNVVPYTNNACLDAPIPTIPSLVDEPFQYNFMPTTTPITTPRRSPKSKPDPSTRLSRSIPFKDVLRSMSGPLFPPEPAEQGPSQDLQNPFLGGCDKRHSWPMSKPFTPQKTPSRTALQRELLANLLKVVEWEEGERKRLKGKSTDLTPRKRQRTNSGPCAACSAVSSSSSAQTTSRSGSWLSFGGSSRSSTSTAATTPSTSPISSWLKSRPSTSSPAPLSLNKVKATLRHSCQPSNRMTRVAASESPLPLPVLATAAPKPEGASSRRSPLVSHTADSKMESRSSNIIFRRMSTLVDLAITFPTAYVSASILNASPSRGTRRERSPPPSTTRPKMGLRPLGSRARPTDVSVFIASSQELSIPPAHAPLYIPLTNTNPPTVSDITARDLTFPPHPQLPRSPFRPLLPPPTVLWRTRPVGNPMMLRLLALQNVLGQRGKHWEGRGRDGMLGCGKERLIGVAWEGLGRSGLSWQMTVVC